MEFKVIETQEELDNIIKKRLEREREKIDNDYKTKLAELQQEKESLSTNVEDLKSKVEQIETLESKIKDYETKELKRKIALERGIPINLADRLNGADEEALKKDADNLKEYFKTQTIVAPMKNLEPDLKNEIDSAYSKLIREI